MDDGRRCALAGCDMRVAPDRSYCSRAHRAAARRSRRAAGHAPRDGGQASALLSGLDAYLLSGAPVTDTLLRRRAALRAQLDTDGTVVCLDAYRHDRCTPPRGEARSGPARRYRAPT